MESSSHGSGSEGTIQDAPSQQQQQSTNEPDLPASSLEISDSIEIISDGQIPVAVIPGGVTLSMMEMETSQTEESTADQEASALAAVPTTESTDVEPSAVAAESPTSTHLNPLAASFIPSFESSIAPLLTGSSSDDQEESSTKPELEPVVETEQEMSVAKDESAKEAEETSVSAESEAVAESAPVNSEKAEIKDDIMISQTVEILEPVLADSKSRGETPPLGAGDIEETKGVELSNDDIADDDDDAEDDDAADETLDGAAGAALTAIPPHIAASVDSLLTTGTESPVMVSPPLSDDGARTPKNSQGSEAGNSSGFEMISSGERSPVEEAPIHFPTGSSEEEIVDVAATVEAAEPPIEVKASEEPPALISESPAELLEAPVEAAADAPVEAAVETPVEAAVEDPVEAVAEAATEAAVETPVEAAIEAPVEAAVEAPVAASVEAPVEAAGTAAAEDLSVAVIAENLAEAAVESPAPSSPDAPVVETADPNQPEAASIEQLVADAAETVAADAAETPVVAQVEEPVAAASTAAPADAQVITPVVEAPVEASAIAAPAAVPVADAAPVEASTAEPEAEEAEPEWEDILGSGTLMKKTVIKGEEGERPVVGQVVSIMTEGKLEDGLQVDLHEKLEFTIGDHDVIQALEIITRLLHVGEVVEVKTDPKFAYGKLGRAPDIPPNSQIHYVIALLEIKPPLEYEKMPPLKRLDHGLAKKERGNVLFKREDYSQAIVSYTKAVKILDADSGGSGDSAGSPSDLQKLLDEKMKVYNNLAATQMKLLAYDQAIKSCDSVIKIQPNNVKALFRKGQALESKKDTAEALNYFKRSLKLDPNSKRIKQDVDRLSKLAKQQEDKEKKLYAKMLGTAETPKPEPKKDNLLGHWASWFGSWAIAVAGTAALVGFTVVAVKSLS